MAELTDGMGIKEAAAYCGLSLSALRQHIYRTKDLIPDATFGGSFVFTKATLDAFLAQRRTPGRPRKSATPPVEPAPPQPE